MTTLGQRIESAVNDYGIGGHVLDLWGDPNRNLVRVFTPIYDSEGRPALMEDGQDIARVLWEVPMTSEHP